MKEIKRKGKREKWRITGLIVDLLDSLDFKERLRVPLSHYFFESKRNDVSELKGFLENFEVDFVQALDHRLNNNPKSKNKIKWKGTQKELAELIIELYKKGWIEGLEYQNVKAFSELITNSFNMPTVKANTPSIYQLLKPQQSKDDQYELTYPQVYTPQYQKRFDLIKNYKG